MLLPKWVLFAVVAGLVWLAAIPAFGAITLRYAIVIGSNTSPGGGVPPLRHAEREARRLADALIHRARFHPDRVVTLTDPDRASLSAALDRIVAQRDLDRAQLGEVRTLFAFFYTGHGQRGRLQLSDTPLPADELAQVFDRVDADFSMGFIDACYSASLHPRLLQKGGVLPLPGVQVFGTLPESALTARGTMWFLSSGPNELSFEDDQLGGVFTHFFVEALERAPRDGPGIRLDQIWRYAQRHTTRFAAAHQVTQKPRLMARVEAESFPYFSFPLRRTARLWLGPAVQGHFVLSYADGNLVEHVVKEPGQAMLLHTYPGAVQLHEVRKGKRLRGRRLTLGSDLVRLHGKDLEDAPVGYQRSRLWRKSSERTALAATVEHPSPSLHLGAGYSFGHVDPRALGAPHAGRLLARLDYGGFTTDVALGYGRHSVTYDTWSYRTDTISGELQAGWGWDLGITRLSLTAGALVEGYLQTFGDAREREGIGVAPLGRLSLVLPTTGWIKAAVAVFSGARYGAQPAAVDDTAWTPMLGARLNVLFQVF